MSQEYRERKRAEKDNFSEREFKEKQRKYNAIIILVVFVLVVGVAVYYMLLAGNDDSDTGDDIYRPQTETLATITVRGSVEGEIVVKLYTDQAPITAQNFIDHGKNGYYDDTYFHRVSPTFMVQGGDPNTKDTNRNNDGSGGHAAKYHEGYGNPSDPDSWVIPDEFGVGLSNVKWTLSMANSGANTGGSQFFINVVDNLGLDGKHAVFGEVISGYDIVMNIANLEGNPGNDGTLNPDNPCYIDSVVISEREISV